MTDRAYRPCAVDESPRRKGDGIEDRQKFEGGTQCEPGHRQRVRVFIEGDGWLAARYDRVGCRFMALYRSLGSFWWYELANDRVRSWTQYPLAGCFVDPVVS